MKPSWIRAWLLSAGLTLCACATSAATGPWAGRIHGEGVFHTVKRGQTLWRIAHTYGVSVDELAEANRLPSTTAIEVGTRLWIPRAKRVLPVPATALAASAPAHHPAATRPPAVAPQPAQPAATADHLQLIWPVRGPVESPFGERGSRQHDGIDIKADKGTPVMAAEEGDVLYSGVQRGYGNIVLVKHAGDLITIYAHNTANKVKVGEHVKRGQIIALVGQTGNATNNHLHFEVRKNRIPRDPMLFLPKLPEPLAVR